MSAALMESLAATADPSSVRAPAEGRVEMMTAESASPSGSEKPKSAAAKVCEPSSVMVMVLSAPVGTSLMDVMEVARLRVSADISVEPPLVETSTVEALARALPELSISRAVSAPGEPLKSAAGRKRSLAVMSR